ncbi:MAG: hypothetical protein ACI9BD_000073 [Candidatus Marinamargulisbacteria bacterium]|jgi:hypothetical protein
MKKNLLFSLNIIGMLFVSGCMGDFGDRTHVLTASGQTEIVIMDFSKAIEIDPIEPGWFHYKFFKHGLNKIDFVKKNGFDTIKISTNDTGSMLMRHIDIPLAEYPRLKWHWFIEDPIDVAINEDSKEGDDHPARFYVVFETDDGEKRNMEIIWGNHLKSGDYKYTGGFPHYVANGGMENIKKWHAEDINLQQIYAHIWSDKKPVNIIELGIFCDSDNTNTSSISYFSNVRMTKNTVNEEN